MTALSEAGAAEAPTRLASVLTPRVVVLAALALGIGVRAIQYLPRPSLLLDEVRLSLNIAGRSWAGLTLPLDYDQTAPLLFLWAEKLATRVGGVNEYTLRFLPFAVSAALLPLLWLVARRLLGAGGAALAVGIAAVSPLLLQYARQVKPYPLDAVVALGLLWWGLDWLDAPGDRRAARRLVVAGVVAVWLSTPAVFVLAGLLAVLAMGPRGARPSLGALLVSATAWATSFLAVYLWIYRPAADNPYMRQFWSESLVSVWRPGFPGRFWQGTRELVWQTFVGGSTEPGVITPFFDLAVNLGVGPLLMLLAVGSARLAAWEGRRRCALVWAPLGVAVTASLVGGYPLAARTMLFAAPALILFAAAGGLAVIRATSAALRPAVAALTGACLLGPPVPLDVELAVRPGAFENVREAARAYWRQRASGESVYVFSAALPAWTFYTTDWKAPDTARLDRMARLGSSGGPAFENAPPRGRAIGVEGDSLVYPLGDGYEIIGLYHGAQGRSAAGLVVRAPDTNWTTNEARRIRHAANPSVWVLTIRALGLERFLYRATELCFDRLYSAEGASLAHFTALPKGSPVCPSMPPGEER